MVTSPISIPSPITWIENNQTHTALWRSEAQVTPPKRIALVDDTLSADSAYKLVCEGTALLWRGDYQNARQLLQALARRIDRKPRKAIKTTTESVSNSFHLHRQTQGHRARILGMLLLQFEPNHRLNLRRAPQLSTACHEAYGKCEHAYVVSLREVLGIIGAHEWRKNGVKISVLNANIHPHYGVFSPVRGEYVDLVNIAPLPSTELAFDIGTGSGVLAAVLARRGVRRIIATDQDPRALSCAQENIERLHLSDQVNILQAHLFPLGRAPLIVCNPPWIPCRPSSPIEYAIYDPDSQMLKGFLNGLTEHLTPKGEGWLILSDIAEHLGLRSREELLGWIEAAHLKVIEKHNISPRHSKSTDTADPLHRARSSEITSLWRLALAN